MTFLEIACFTKESAILANSHGADRIELCVGFRVGGTTPSLALLQEVKRSVSIPVFAMLRPRGGDFNYTSEEFLQMQEAMKSLKPVADGFVFGILDQDRNVDMERNKQLIDLAASLPCTFHRAFDETLDMTQSLSDVDRCGFRHILTSGGAADAAAGAHTLASLVHRAKDLRIHVMAGGGVRSGNLVQLLRATGAVFCHSSAITGSNPIADAEEIIALKNICQSKLE